MAYSVTDRRAPSTSPGLAEPPASSLHPRASLRVLECRAFPPVSEAPGHWPLPGIPSLHAYIECHIFPLISAPSHLPPKKNSSRSLDLDWIISYSLRPSCIFWCESICIQCVTEKVEILRTTRLYFLI